MSQKTALTSLPLSTASEIVWQVCNNWLVVESPCLKPDCKHVRISLTVIYVFVYSSFHLFADDAQKRYWSIIARLIFVVFF